MRATLCDYVMEHMDTEFENLGSLTPRQTIQRDYIDGGQLLTNPEKTSEEQNITSIPIYRGLESGSAKNPILELSIGIPGFSPLILDFCFFKK